MNDYSYRRAVARYGDKISPFVPNSSDFVSRIVGVVVDLFAMTLCFRSNRPARAAIAAVLALSSTSVLAQELGSPPAAGTVAPPPVASDPAPQSAVAATATPVMAPSTPVVQQTASVEARLAEAVAKAKAEKAATPVRRTAAPVAPKPLEAKAGRSVDRPLPPALTTPAVERTPQPTPALNTSISSPEATPAAQLDTTPAPAPTQATAMSSGSDDGIALALGGAALLLAGVAGTAMAMRRRRSPETAGYQDDAPLTPAAGQAPAAEPISCAEPAPMPVVAPAPAPVRSQDAAMTDLDAMIAAPPSPENPFLTHAKRKRRAMALLRARETGVASAPSISPRPAVAPARTPADRSQTVYSFGKAGGRRTDWKPGIG